MSLHPSSAAGRRSSRRESRNNRVTVWPTTYGEDIEFSAPDPGRRNTRHVDQRWTGAFDSEGRAHRMSFLVSGSLLPPPIPSGQQQPQFWPTPSRKGSRATWMDDSHFRPNFRESSQAPWVDAARHQKNARFWDGSFAVEKRPSFIHRPSANWSRYAPDIEEEKEKEIWKEPFTEEQIAQADSTLVSVDVLNHEWEGLGTLEDPFLVRWMPVDPANPLEFPTSRKWTNAVVLAFAVFMVSIASSGFSQGTADIQTEFNVNQTVALLMTSLFVFGFAVGALALSPLSEVYGRRDLYVWTFGAFVVTSGVIGLAPSMTFVLVFRSLGGLAGSFTQAVAPAVIADIFRAQERGFVLSIFTLAGLMGQMLGPIACGFLDAAFGWRSLAVLIAAASFPTWLILTVTFPETYAPTLLKRRAAKLAKITGKTFVVEGLEEEKTIGTQLRVGALRPWVMLIYEPIVTLLSLFLSVVHGTLFLLFAAYPIVFQQVRGWPQGVASLPFLAIAVGIVISLFYVALVDQKRYAKVSEKYDGCAPPEARLPPAILGSVALPIGLFWFAWTNDPSTYWLISVSAGVLFGFGMVLLYMSITSFLVDCYLGYAGSALAATTVLRSIAGAIFPLFTKQMYDSLGIHWASSVPGFLALMFVPCLVAFYKYGHIIRSKTRFGQEAARIAEMMEGGE